MVFCAKKEKGNIVTWVYYLLQNVCLHRKCQNLDIAWTLAKVTKKRRYVAVLEVVKKSWNVNTELGGHLTFYR